MKKQTLMMLNMRNAVRVRSKTVRNTQKQDPDQICLNFSQSSLIKNLKNIGKGSFFMLIYLDSLLFFYYFFSFNFILNIKSNYLFKASL